jgi:hypothetical protein
LYRYAATSPTNFNDPSGEILPLAAFFIGTTILDASDLLLSGRKHSKADYAFFFLSLTPPGRILKLAQKVMRVTGLSKAFLSAEVLGHIIEGHGVGSLTANAGKNSSITVKSLA